MLRAGIDVSGDEEHGNHRYMAIVIGTEDCINSQMEKMGLKQLHMRTMTTRKRRKLILDTLDFSNKDILALCIRIEKKRTLAQLQKSRKHRHDPHLARTAEARFDKILWQYINGKMRDFATQHNETLVEIHFQCDADCRDFVRRVGLHPADCGNAYCLVDTVAWFNSHGKEPKGVRPMNLYADILERLKKG